MTETSIDLAEATLFYGGVPAWAKKHLALNYRAYGDVRQMARYWEEGETGHFKGFEVFRYQYDRYPGLHRIHFAFAPEAIGLIARRPPPTSGGISASAFAESETFGVRVDMSHPMGRSYPAQFTIGVLFGCGVMRNSYGVQVYS